MHDSLRVPSPAAILHSPQRRPPGETRHFDMAESADPVLSGVRVLVVDDDPDARELFAYLLTTNGALVHEADSAAAALEVFGRERFDVLTIDGGMPDQTGWNLIEIIRRLPPEQGGHVPAVAITSFAYPEDVARSLAAGFQVHLSKPVEIEELIATIAALTGRSRS